MEDVASSISSVSAHQQEQHINIPQPSVIVPHVQHTVHHDNIPSPVPSWHSSEAWSDEDVHSHTAITLDNGNMCIDPGLQPSSMQTPAGSSEQHAAAASTVHNPMEIDTHANRPTHVEQDPEFEFTASPNLSNSGSRHSDGTGRIRFGVSTARKRRTNQ